LRVHGEGLRLEQVLINILGNALDALKGRPSPHITIDIHADSAHVTLTIDDNGPGMPEEVLPHVFEPFYTTKDIGEGLGLGLAISSSILRDCGGTLSASNRPEGGARFVVVLRRSDGAQGIES
jgi:two-component system, NtrC family, C4-dicarboxylate transport sensor histidine kinase DctB